MKKLLILLLTLTLVLGLGGAVFASEPGTQATVPNYTDSSPITINKALTANPLGSNPEETFEFTIEAGTGIRDGVQFDAPVFRPDTFSITVSEAGTTGTALINFPTFTEVGEYTYPVTEDLGNTAGFDYDAAIYDLKITVINNPAYPGIVPGTEGDEVPTPEPEFLRVLTMIDGNNLKTDSFQNTFDAGNLTIKKESVGNFADPDDTFTVTVTLTPIGDLVLKDDVIDAPDYDSYLQDPTTGVVTIVYTVKDGSEFTITDIPYDVLYTVEESPNTIGYEVSYDGKESGEINAGSIETKIKNTRNKEIDTGISLDSLPYILLIIGAVVGMGVLFLKKRKHADM